MDYSNYLGKDVIVRGNRSGATFGRCVQVSEDGKLVELIQGRRLWFWSGAFCLHEIAMLGVKDPVHCKFPIPVKRCLITDCMEIIPVTEEAKQSIDEVPIWSV